MAGRTFSSCMDQVYAVQLDPAEDFFRFSLYDLALTEYTYTISTTAGSAFEAELDAMITYFNTVTGVSSYRNGYKITFVINTC